jgi:hypothetical protein
MRSCCADFLSHDAPKSLVASLSLQSRAVRRDELIVYLRLLHGLAMHAEAGAFDRPGLAILRSTAELGKTLEHVADHMQNFLHVHSQAPSEVSDILFRIALTVQQIIDATGVDRNSVDQALHRLVESGDALRAPSASSNSSSTACLALFLGASDSPAFWRCCRCLAGRGGSRVGHGGPSNQMLVKSKWRASVSLTMFVGSSSPENLFGSFSPDSCRAYGVPVTEATGQNRPWRAFKRAGELIA